MNYKIRDREEMLIRVVDYLKDHGDKAAAPAKADEPEPSESLEGSGRESRCAGVEALAVQRATRQLQGTHAEKMGATRGRERIPLRAT